MTTDNEVIKIAERCINDDHCGNCPLEYLSDECQEFRLNLLPVMFEIISRLQAEKEALIKGQETLQKYIEKLNKLVE